MPVWSIIQMLTAVLYKLSLDCIWFNPIKV